MSGRDRRYSAAWRRFSVVVLRPTLRAVIKHEWRGHEHVPREGGVIIAANHLSYADWPTVGLFCYESGRYPVFLIKSSMFDVKVVGGFLRRIGQLPVHRGSGDAALVLKDAQQALADGECVVVYPEGTASRDPDLWPMRARTGVARLALATGAPVIPVAHWGAQDILPYGSVRPRLLPRGTVRLVAGPPVDLSAYAGQPITAATLREVTATVMAAVTALLAQLRGAQPPAVPFDPAAARRGGESVSRTNAGDGPGSGDGGSGTLSGAADGAGPQGPAAAAPDAGDVPKAPHP